MKNKFIIIHAAINQNWIVLKKEPNCGWHWKYYNDRCDVWHLEIGHPIIDLHDYAFDTINECDQKIKLLLKRKLPGYNNFSIQELENQFRLL